jgi:hypothetical protein
MRGQGGAGGRPAEARARHWLDVDTPGLVQHEWNDGTTVSFRDPSVSFQDARVTALVAAQLATRGAHETFEELKHRMTASNPLRFFLLIDALQRMMRMKGASAHGYDPLQELVGGILTSLDPQTVMSRRYAEIREDDFTAMELLVRQLAAHASQARVGDYLEDEDDRGVDTRFLLAAEEQFDRTAGYTENLRAIASDVLTQLDDLEPEIGFRLSDVVRAADAQLDDQLTRLQVVHDGIHQASRESEDAAPTSGESTAFAALERVASVIEHNPVPVIAAALSVDLDVASRLVDSFATPLGTQQVVSLTRSNRLRQFPAIKLPDGTYIWTSPQDCLHEILEWADLYLADRARPAWRQRLSRARAATTERLTAQALASVYGADRVIRNLEYCEADGSWIETDVVIDLGAAAVIVEAKSQRITPQGRSATAGRVRTKVEEFLVRPLSQTSRASCALLEGALVRARRRELPRMKPSVVRRLIVNLDRVDPFVTHAHRLVSAAVNDSDVLETDAWIVSLADLLTVTHLLRTSTELWAYHGKRAAQTATGSPVIFMESDALGAWIKSREGAWPTQEGQLFQLAFSSEEINAYYNYRDFVSRGAGVEAVPPPTSCIPDEVLRTMTSLIDNDSWAEAADAIANVPPAEWGRFRRDMQRLTATPRTRSQRRSLAAVERGIEYGKEPRVIIKPGSDPHLEVATGTGQMSDPPQNVVGHGGVTSTVTLIVPRTASAS